MKERNVIFPIILILSLIVMISYITISHINSVAELNKSANDLSEFESFPKTFLDLNDPIAMEKEYKKILHYESIEGNPVRHLNLFEKKEESNSSKLRSLADSNVFNEEISFITPTSETFPWSYIFIRVGVGLTYNEKPNLYVYPYAFTYTSNNSEGKEVKYYYPQGAYMSTNTSYYKTTYGAKTNKPFYFYRARSVSYSDIAILSVVGIIRGINEELFQDHIDYCTFLNTKMGLKNFEDFDLYFEEKMNKPNLFYSTKINETNIIQGKLMIGETPRFKALIVPDYKSGTDEIIKAKLGEQGIKEILNYYNKGGIIIITGKSGTLFEDFGLIQKGTYDRKRLFKMDTAERKVGMIGCSELYNKPYDPNVDDFEKRMICMSYFNYRRIGLSSTFKTIKKDESFKTLLELNSTDEKLVLVDSKDGLIYSLTEEEKKYNPLILFKSNEKNGQLFVLNYNPLLAGTDIHPTLNVLMLIFTNELFINTKVNVKTLTGNSVIPAGESGFEIDIETSFKNYYDKEIRNLKIYYFIPNNMDWSLISKNCIKQNDLSKVPNNIKNKRSFKSESDYLLCEYEKIPEYENITINNKISILNYAATQIKEKVEMLDEIAIFNDYNGREKIVAEYSKVDCQSAAVLRAAINIDPMGSYPIFGNGTMKDNSIKIENKGESEALDVEYYGTYSIISPLVDHSEQDLISYRLKYYVDYYNKNNYLIPFSDDHTEQDFIDPYLLSDKGVYIILDWDSPVLVSKIIDSSGRIPETPNITNIEFSPFIINSTIEIIRQINYKNSDRFYKIAYQRLTLFVDDTTPEGAKTLYGDNIPIEILDPVFKDRAKIDLIFIRQDLYYYDDQNFINPEGVNENIIFSVDKLEKYEDKTNCKPTRAVAHSKLIKKGYYTNREEDKKNTITSPHIWSNRLFEVCNLKIIDPTNEEEIIKEFGNLETYKPVHYIYSNKYKNITQPDQIMDFVAVNNYYGYHKEYPQIKFLYLHRLDFTMENKYCIYGGRIIINIKENIIKNVNQVTVSPDQIAVYNITFSNGNITIYFKRGLMSNEQFGKDMNLIINIEGLPSQKNETFKIIVESLKYDISSSPNYDKYIFIYEKDVIFQYTSAFSFPALEIKSKLNRTFNSYEILEPFSRYGVYIQEIKHRCVYLTFEAHYLSDPGITSNFPGGADAVSHLGINPVPFVEYVTAGKTPYSPSTETTSRIKWKDIWGREWYQPIRSTYGDYVVVPPPVKNFVMTTTFEILRDGKQIMEWPSDENVQIHLHIKLLNNYLKYWEITRCLQNNIRFIPKNIKELKDGFPQVHSESLEEELKDEELTGNNMFIKQGSYSSYGICYYDKGTVVRGENVTDEVMEQIKYATLCEESRDPNKIEECMQKLKDIPTVNKSPEDWNMTKLWNYSPLVENFYPEGYIDNQMWTMNSYEYEDNNVNKGYKGHMDNQLPNYDNFLNKTLNVIAVPLYKGLGYNIIYDLNNEMNYHKTKKRGWWCDNLQNKDDTLLSGQNKVNKISVDKKEEIIWVEEKDLVGSTREGSNDFIKAFINMRNKNIYTCLFNRKRAQYKKDCNKVYFPNNICQNNIVPVLVDLEKNDKRYTNYNCDKEQYTPDNIHEEKGNLLITPTDKDYLYFAANLRGSAKESFNILLNLTYFDKVKYEGTTKINEGGRFIYYNPGWGANAYMVYDSPVSSINAKRNDITIENDVLPKETTTFNAVLYHYYTIKDEKKINKEWPYKTYYRNSYGFGDVSITVAVGGYKESKPIIEPGETTYAQIIFYNNCGFDWNMKKGAIDFIYKGEKAINAHDYMYDFTHTIQEPIKYNFLNYIIEDRYKEYISIKPSNHSITTSPEFFDFGFINVVTIRDGFKGEYDLQIDVSNSFPDKLRGKLIEIKIELNTSYFDHFPGTNTDPTNINKYHDYKVIIPSLYIAVPYKDEPFKGKVLYTSAQAKLTELLFFTYLDTKTEGKYIDREIVKKFNNCSGSEDPLKELNKLWNSLKDYKSLEFKEVITTNKRVTITNVAKDYSLFPKINNDGPDEAEFSILLKTTFSQLDKGITYPIYSPLLYYTNWINKPGHMYGQYKAIQIKGAWIDLSYSRSLVDYISEDVYIEKTEQELSPAEEGIIKVQFKLENIGNGDAYNVIFNILIGKNVTYFAHRKGINLIGKKETVNGTLLSFDLNSPINSNDIVGGIIYLKYNKIIDKEYLETEAIKQIPNELKVAEESSVILDLTDKKGENSVTQILRKSLVFAYTNYQSSSVYIDLILSGKRTNPSIEIKPKILYRGNYTTNNLNISVDKIVKIKIIENENKNTNEEYNITSIYPKGKFKEEIEDKSEKSKDMCLYTVYVYTKEGIISNKIKLELNEIGLSTSEIVLIIISCIFYALSMLIVFLSYNNYKRAKINDDFTSEKTTNQLLDSINE